MLIEGKRDRDSIRVISFRRDGFVFKGLHLFNSGRFDVGVFFFLAEKFVQVAMRNIFFYRQGS